jgi:hypothetical protein
MMSGESMETLPKRSQFGSREPAKRLASGQRRKTVGDHEKCTVPITKSAQIWSEHSHLLVLERRLLAA